LLIQVIGIPKEELATKQEVVAERYAAAQKITGISQLHSFVFHPNAVVEAAKCHGGERILLKYPLEHVKTLTEQETIEDVKAQLYELQEWVAVLFEEDWFPGFIEEIKGTNLTIKFMKKKEFNQ
jgi:hypothetical protein